MGCSSRVEVAGTVGREVSNKHLSKFVVVAVIWLDPRVSFLFLFPFSAHCLPPLCHSLEAALLFLVVRFCCFSESRHWISIILVFMEILQAS